MALTKEALQALVALQQKDKHLDAIQYEIDAVPPRIDALKADLENEKRHMNEAKARILELEKKKKTKELDVAAQDEAARKHSGQLNDLKSNDAYKAMQAEIEKEKAKAGDIETEILQIMEDIDAAKAVEKAATAEFKKTEEFSKKDLEKLEAELSHAKGRFETAKVDRDATEAAVAPSELKVYNHIRSRGKPDAVVPVINGHCGSCQINLTPGLILEVAKLKNLVTCDSCQRILYKPELLVPATAQ
ncbi:MAG: C4-type zinc ribbon domain-containing protein [Elusimicrobia bacterium]|nr:C4-type zinc ribbon domain-containing protein [Elusimicrobiota bacterium]